MFNNNIANIGEIGLLDLIEKRLKGAVVNTPLLSNALSSTEVILGFGDDCAAIKIDKSHYVLLSTDILVEDVHFRKSYFLPYQLGYKALAVNISDIAAMGGVPAQALVGLAIPSNTSISFVDELYNGLIKTGQEYGIKVIGGDTVRSNGPIMLSMTILGAVEEENMVTRSGAQTGNRIMVTGELGSAMLGLEILEHQEDFCNKDEKRYTSNQMCSRFIHPIPRVKEARAIALNHLATSMIDLSDSLSQDLTNICRSSDVGARIKKQSLPLAPEVKKMIIEKGKDPFSYALAGGEDYEILFTVRSEDVEVTKDLVFKETGTTVHEIGEICPAKEGIILIDEIGYEKSLAPSGYDHFSPGN